MSKCVVVVTASPNLDRLKTIRNDVDNLYSVISVSPQIPEWHTSLLGVTFLKDDYFLNRNSFNNLNIPRKGWYYQQFLKYEIVLKLAEYSQVHVVDGDSILRKDLYFNHFVRYTPIVINHAYNRYLRDIGITPRQTNFITNEMSFKRVELVEMLNELNCSLENYIPRLAEKITEFSWFSEYQMYALFKAKRKKENITEVKVFRRYDLLPIWMIKLFKRDYSIIAYESYHSQDFLRKIRALLFFVLNKNLG